MHEFRAAQKDDWKTFPMPEQQEQFTIPLAVSDQEYESIKLGYIPREMEDKWFLYMDRDTLYIHRSWTGFCIYVIHFASDRRSARVIANRDPSQYTNTDQETDRLVIQSRLSFLLQNGKEAELIKRYMEHQKQNNSAPQGNNP